MGRFLSVDPEFQFPTNTQSLNAYSYVLNNPLSLTDPSGHDSDSSCTSDTKGACASDTQLKDLAPGTKITVHVTTTEIGSHISTSSTLTATKTEGNGSDANNDAAPSSTAGPDLKSASTGGQTGPTVKTENRSESAVTATGGGVAKCTSDCVPSHDVKRDPAHDAWALSHASLLPSPSAANELTLAGTAEFGGTWYITDGCYNAGCSVGESDVGLETFTNILHSHQFSLQETLSAKLNETFQRELPGPGDWQVVYNFDVVNYFRAPSGVVRAIEYYGGSYHVSTVTPGAPDAFGQADWKPNQPTNPLSPAQQGIVWRASRDESQDFNRLWQEGLPH